MAAQTYTDAGTAPREVLRFLASPTDVNWGGKVHGGIVMRWIDEAAHVLIQKQLPSGAFAPPGMHVGPKGIPWKGGDNAEVGAFWNKSFEKAGYPPGYRPIQHGEAGGTAANFKTAGEKFDPSMDVRKQVWEPGDTWDSERLVVAAQADNIGGVGLAESWGKMDAFHAANPMGQFRFSRPGK